MKRWHSLIIAVCLVLAVAANAHTPSPEVAAKFMAARAALVQNKVDEALKLLDQVIEMDAKVYLAYFLRGIIYQGKKLYDQAIDDFTQAISLHEWEAPYILRGNCYLLKGLADKAIADYNKAQSLKPDDGDVYYYRAYAYYQVKQFDKSKADVKQAQQLGKKFDERFLKELEKASNRGEPAPQPEPAPRPVPSPFPAPEPRATTRPAPRAETGELSLSQLIKTARPAVVTIFMGDEQGKVVGQGSGFFINAQGQVATNYHVIRMGVRGSVKTADNKVYPIKSVLAHDAYGDLAICQVEMDQPPARFLEVSADMPEVGDRVVVIGSPLGLELTVSEGIVSAIRDKTHKGQAFQMTAPISPGNSGGPVLNLKGQVIGVATFFRGGGQNLNFAIPGRRLLALRPGPGKPLAEVFEAHRTGQGQELYRQGKQFFEQKQYKKAMEAFQQALKLDPKNPSLHNYLGLTYKKLEFFEDALKSYQEAIRLKPTSSVYYYNLGMLYYDLKMYQQSVEALKLAIKNNSQDADNHYLLGKAYARLKQRSAALEHYRELKKLDPKLAEKLRKFMGD